jgi:hypothetical protein
MTRKLCWLALGWVLWVGVGMDTCTARDGCRSIPTQWRLSTRFQSVEACQQAVRQLQGSPPGGPTQTQARCLPDGQQP